jgi:hypothetical protein
MVRGQVITVGVRQDGVDFLRKELGIFGRCGISMNNEPPPIDLQMRRSKFREDINTG